MTIVQPGDPTRLPPDEQELEFLGDAERFERSEDVDLESEDRSLIPAGGEVAGHGSMLRQMVRVFAQNKLAVLSLFYLVFITVACFFGPLVYHSLQNAGLAITEANNTCYNNSPLGIAGPMAGHPLGCTPDGLDELGRILDAGKYSLIVGYVSAIVTMTFGVFYGIVAGYKGGKLDTVLMRVNDMFLSIPGLYLILLIISFLGRGTVGLIMVIGFTGWFGVARLMRGEALMLRDREYSQAVRAMGGGSSRIIWKHILPNSMSTMATAGTFALGDSILALTALGFLGLGLQAPLTDWGTMIQEGSTNFYSGAWWQIWPLAIIFILVVLSTNYIGDALRDAFEVRLQER
jgi:peptide/nickel transport system permease protein